MVVYNGSPSITLFSSVRKDEIIINNYGAVSIVEEVSLSLHTERRIETIFEVQNFLFFFQEFFFMRHFFCMLME